MGKKSVITESQEIQLAIELIRLGARLQLLESETSLSRERLLKLYKELKGMSPPKGMLKALPTVLKGSRYNKALYMELMAMLFEILTKARKEGLMSIEGDIEEPEASPIFSKYPGVRADHHLVEFMTDYGDSTGTI